MGNENDINNVDTAVEIRLHVPLQNEKQTDILKDLTFFIYP